MGAAGPDGFVRWLLESIAGVGRVQAERACRNGGRVDVMLADQAGTRWAVIAGLDGRDR